MSLANGQTAYILSSPTYPPTTWTLRRGTVTTSTFNGLRMPGDTLDFTDGTCCNVARAYPTLLEALEVHGLLSEAVWSVRRTIRELDPAVDRYIRALRTHGYLRAHAMAKWDSANPAPTWNQNEVST